MNSFSRATAYAVRHTGGSAGNWNFRSHVLLLPRAKVRGNESSRERKFHLYFRSWEQKYVGTKVP